MRWPKFPRFDLNLTKSSFFKDACRKSFAEVDVDHDGQMDVKELYIALLKLYDILNAKLPCHVTVPSMVDIHALLGKYDADKSGKLDEDEYLLLCRNLVGSRKNWRDSLALKIVLVVVTKVVVIPFLGKALKQGIVSIPKLEVVEKVPVAVMALVAEVAVKKTGLIPL